MDTVRQKRTLATHDGAFHADEVTACALLILFDQIDKDKIVRSRKEEDHARAEFVCDVGGIFDPSQKRFDHHQADYSGDLSSAGMVLLYLRDQGIVSDPLYHYYNDSLIRGVDAHDTGNVEIVTGHMTFSMVIHNFLPVRLDATSEERDRAFFTAIDFVLGQLAHLKERFEYIESCKAAVKEAMDRDTTCLFFDKPLPWFEPFFELGGENHPAQFLIMPSGPHWKLRGIPPSKEDRMAVRTKLPQKWGGLLADELQKVSGIEGAVFCHKGLFISVWKTKEAAIAALEKIV